MSASALSFRAATARPAQLRAAPRRCSAARAAVVQTRAGNIVETAVAAGSFKTLVAAVTAAGLAETLSGGSFTVFAPTDEAFAKLPAGTVEDLLKPENKGKLVDILTYHVVKGKNLSKHVVNAPSIPTLNKDGIKITIDTKTGGKGVVRVGCKEPGKQGLESAVIGGAITKADIECSNGLIHVIDAVMIPIPPPPPSNGGGYSF